MQIDEKLLNKLEHLSALKLNEDERKQVLVELEEILEFAENMDELDLSNLSDFVNIIGGYTPFREDVPVLDNSKDMILQNTKSDNGYFVVPKIIE